MQERRKLLAMVGRDRQLREPEGGWKSLRQIKTASQRTRADAQLRAHLGCLIHGDDPGGLWGTWPLGIGLLGRQCGYARWFE